MKTPRCDELDLVRTSAVNKVRVISTSALYDAVGPRLYQDAVPHFYYHCSDSGPAVWPIENWLCQNWSKIRKVKR